MKYRDRVHEWCRLVQQQEISVEENIISADSVDTGTFYKFVNKRLTNRSEVISVTDMDGAELINDLDTANAFNNYFASVVVGSNNLTPTVPLFRLVTLFLHCHPLASVNVMCLLLLITLKCIVLKRPFCHSTLQCVEYQGLLFWPTLYICIGLIPLFYPH